MIKKDILLDLPSQVEFNRQKNVTQDNVLATLSSQVNMLVSQKPSGFIPRVYYGLVRGAQTYRFIPDAVANVTGLTGQVGDAYEFINKSETDNYIPAVGIMINSTQIKIQIQGDYNVDTDTYDIINMRTGAELTDYVLGSMLATQYSSYLGDYPAEDNINKQVTVLHDLQTGQDNAIFASVDFSGDDVYNWVRIGSYSNGVDGASVYSVSQSTESTIFANLKQGDSIIVASAFTHDGVDYDTVGDVFYINSVSPLSTTNTGNIRGAQGEQGVQGEPGTNGTNGLTPTIGADNHWYIGDVDTGVVAIGQDGADGQNGQAFQIQSGLYSAPANEGDPDNLDPDGNALNTLPVLPSSSVTGKGYVVYDQVTTPLEPFYDLYWANNGDASWTIMHPFSGIKGQDGANGYTPYISGGYWYINGTNTGTPATGPQGPTGATGATPNVSATATGLAAGASPTVTKTGTLENPIFNFGIPKGDTGVGVAAGGTAGQYLIKNTNSDYDTTWKTFGSGDVVGALGYTPYNSTNPNGYISGITSSMVRTALGYTPYNSTNPSGYISGINSSMVTTALGYTPATKVKAHGTIPNGTNSLVLNNLGISADEECEITFWCKTSDGTDLTMQINGATSGYRTAGWASGDGSNPVADAHQNVSYAPCGYSTGGEHKMLTTIKIKPIGTTMYYQIFATACSTSSNSYALRQFGGCVLTGTSGISVLRFSLSGGPTFSEGEYIVVSKKGA